jgi:DNA-binding TFAR19-related protein (PDSD5 family)
MSERELERLRQKKMLELMRRLGEKPKEEPAKAEAAEPKDVLNQFFIERAWEVFNAAKSQYPTETEQIGNMLVKLITEGKIQSKITGGELYGLFRRLGLRVHLDTHIQVLEHGKVKSLEEKIKEETAK